jgi:hypothetical protein
VPSVLKKHSWLRATFV